METLDTDADDSPIKAELRPWKLSHSSMQVLKNSFPWDIARIPLLQATGGDEDLFPPLTVK